jgi:hypothetical protein
VANIVPVNSNIDESRIALTALAVYFGGFVGFLVLAIGFRGVRGVYRASVRRFRQRIESTGCAVRWRASFGYNTPPTPMPLRMTLIALGVAVIIVLLTKLVHIMDVCSAVAALLASSGALSEMWAAMLGVLVAIVFWWTLTTLLLLRLRVPRRAGSDFDAG